MFSKPYLSRQELNCKFLFPLRWAAAEIYIWFIQSFAGWCLLCSLESPHACMHAQLLSNQPRIYLQIIDFVFLFYGFILSWTPTHPGHFSQCFGSLELSSASLDQKDYGFLLEFYLNCLRRKCVTVDLIQCGFFLPKFSCPLCLLSLQCFQKVVSIFVLSLHFQ